MTSNRRRERLESVPNPSTRSRPRRSGPASAGVGRRWRGGLAPAVGAVAVLLLLLGLAVTPARAQPAPLEGLDEYVQAAMEEWGAPGLALAVVRSDSVVYVRGYGVRELGGDEPVDEHTLFAVGSTSKAFTTATVAMLVEEGVLDWDDHVVDHLPGFRLHEPHVTGELTVRDLVTHRSGLPRCDRLWYGTGFDRAEVLRRVRHCEPDRQFRAEFGYQNILYLAAGEIVGRLAGDGWDEFVAREIFRPLGMARTNTSVKELEGMENVATPHAEVEGEVRPVPWRDLDNVGPAGSINSSVAEMASWLRLHLNYGTFDGEKLLDTASVQEMHTPQTVLPPTGLRARTAPEARFHTYGLGWFVRDHRGRQMVEHGGAIDGMRAQVALLPEEDVGVVILTNRDGLSLSRPLAFRVLDAYLLAPERDWAGEFRAIADSLQAEAEERRQRRAEARVPGTAPAWPLDRYAGTYDDDLYGPARVTVEDGGLVLRYGSGIAADLEHWHFEVFRAHWREPAMEPSFVTFRMGPDAQPRAVEVQGLGEFRRADPDT